MNMAGGEGTKNKYRCLLKFPQHRWVLPPVTRPNYIIPDNVTTVLQVPCLQALSITQILPFLISSVFCTDACHVISSATTPFDTRVFTVPEILQLSYKK